MITFISGAIFLGWLCCALFFLRFWNASGDRFFAFLAAAFLLMAIGRVLLTFVGHENEYFPFIYLLRAFSYAVIVVGIVDKNRRKES